MGLLLGLRLSLLLSLLKPAVVTSPYTENLNQRTDYCTLPCPKTKHIACNSTCSTAEGLEAIYSTFIWRLNMLNLHNALRDMVAAGNYQGSGHHSSSNMQILNYHLRLEFTATCWLIAYDKPEKSPCPIVPMFRHVTQNLYVGPLDPRTDEGIEGIVTSWFMCINDTTDSQIDSYSFTTERAAAFTAAVTALAMAWFMGINDTTDSQIDTYSFTTERAAAFTAAAWATTTHIGCAAVIKERMFRVLCNYAPGGNVQHKSVFWRGKPRSECPNLADAVYPNLCGRRQRLSEAFYQVGNPEMRRWKRSAAATAEASASATLAAVLLLLVSC